MTSNVFGALTGPVSLHWSGDQLLYTTDQNGALNEFFIGSDAIILCSSASPASPCYDNVEIRGSSGERVTSYNNGNAGDFELGPNRYALKGPVIGGLNYQPMGSSAIAPNPNFGYLSVDNVRTDGLTIGSITVQGVREFNADAAQWSSPDAFKGTVADPLSQMPYVWNRDNPISYSDPSGFCTLLIGCPTGETGLGIGAALRAVGSVASGLVDVEALGALAGPVGIVVGLVAVTQSSAGNENEEEQVKARSAQDPLPRDKSPEANAEGPHTQLGTRTSKGTGERYRQAREFDKDGKPVKDIDFTDHGRPDEHTNPHEHPYEENATGGSMRRGDARPLTN